MNELSALLRKTPTLTGAYNTGYTARFTRPNSAKGGISYSPKTLGDMPGATHMFTFHCEICQKFGLSPLSKSIVLPAKVLSMGIGPRYRNSNLDTTPVDVRVCGSCYRRYHTYVRMLNSLRPANDFQLPGWAMHEFYYEDAMSAAFQALTRFADREPHVQLYKERLPSNKWDMLKIKWGLTEWNYVRTREGRFIAYVWYP